MVVRCRLEECCGCVESSSLSLGALSLSGGGGDVTSDERCRKQRCNIYWSTWVLEVYSKGIKVGARLMEELRSIEVY